MKTKVKCAECTAEFERENSELRRTKNSFCDHTCAATYNNKKRPRSLIRQEALKRRCKNCDKKLVYKDSHYTKIYCNSQCQQKYQYREYIKRWLAGEETGNKGSNQYLVVSGYVRKWLYETRGERCEICGWNKKNPTSDKVPVETHHLDGNSRNTTPENIRLLCPNCHSLTPTHRALNRGNGRKRVYT